jgi:hypothetical protein
MEEKKLVAYIDLLGFSNHVHENISDAVRILIHYSIALQSKIRNNRMYPIDSYENGLKELAKRTSIDSFEYVIPFSDSIFIVSNDANDFVPQISSFIYNCLYMTSPYYINPKDSGDPTKVDMVNFTNGQIDSIMLDTHYHPAIFRGGMAYGEVLPIDIWGIIDTEPQKLKVLAGEAIVRAVELEKTIKGPRVIFEQNTSVEQNTFDLLNDEVKSRYIRKKLKAKIFMKFYGLQSFIFQKMEKRRCSIFMKCLLLL